MSLVGSVSLSNNQNGMYLGKVNINNLNASANEILYTKDGANIKGNSNLTYNDALSILSAPTVISNNITATDLSGTNLTVTNINGSSYPPSSITINNQATTRIPYETSTSNTLNSNNNLTFNDTTNTLAVPNITVTNINGSSYPPSSVTINNQATKLIPYETSISNTLNSNANLSFDDTTNTLAVPNVTVTNLNGSAPVSVTSQANNRLITATATTNTLHANQDATWDGTQLILFNSNTMKIGRGNNVSSSNTNTTLGKGLQSITTGTENTIIGNNNEAITTAGWNTVIGSSNGGNMTAGGNHSDIVLIGNNNNISNNAVVGTVNIGSNNTSAGSNNQIIGKLNLSTGISNSIIGTRLASSTITGSENVLIGFGSALTLTAGTKNVILGVNTDISSNPTNCVTIGNLANSKGGTGNISIGYSSASNGKIGANAGLALGYTSQTGTTYNNCAVIGNNIPSTTVTADNQFWLGNSTNNLYATTAIINPSDTRDKIDIKDAELGLDFINKLKPRMWRANPRSAYVKQVETEEGVQWEKIENDGSKAGTRYHYGVIAQEMKQTMDEMGVDFVALKDTSVTGNGEGDLGVAYGEFFGVLIKAVQELSAKVKALESK